MLAAGVVDGVKTRDRTANAAHLEIKEDADRRRLVAHHVVHKRIKADHHRKYP